MALIASGRTRLASVPAENASKRSPPNARSKASAIWLRAELWVHKNSTRRVSVPVAPPVMVHSVLMGVPGGTDLQGDVLPHRKPRPEAYTEPCAIESSQL